MKSVKKEHHYRYYGLTRIHLIIVSIIIIGILLAIFVHKAAGTTVMGFGIYTLLSYWIPIIYFGKRQKPYESEEAKVGPNEIIIRPAGVEDASIGARLMFYAGPNYMLAFFGKTEDKAVSVLRRMFPLPGHMTSYSYAFVAEDKGEVVGLFSGLDGKNWRACARASWMYGPVWWIAAPIWQIPRMIGAFNDFDMPAVSDEEYYIEHLAVLPELRGQRIGEQQMEFAENQARTKGLKRIALDVEIENEGARQFYQRLGFQEAKVVTKPSYCKRFSFQGSIRVVKAISKL